MRAERFVNHIKPLAQEFIVGSIDIGLTIYNRLEIKMDPDVPKKPPVLILVNHAGLLDTPAMMVTDPYNPKSVPMVKEEFSHNLLLGKVLNMWDAIYAKRDGSDVFKVKKQVRDVLLTQRRGLCIAAEGSRSRSGRLEGLNPHLVKITLEMAVEGVPVIVAGIDAYDAMPPGSRLPKPKKIVVKVSGPLDLSKWAKPKITREELYKAGVFIQDAIASRLPEHRKPLPDTPALRNFNFKNKEQAVSANP